MGVLFHRKPVAQTPTQLPKVAEIPQAPPELIADAAGPSPKVNEPASPPTKALPRVKAQRLNTQPQRDTVLQLADLTSVAATEAQREGIVDWTLLPPCPIGGYEMTREGLRDNIAPGKPLLTPVQLETLILEASSLEMQAKAAIDHALPEHVRLSVQHKLTSTMGTMFGVLGLILLGYKAPRNYGLATPRESILFKSKFAAWATGIEAWDEHRRELFSRRYRRMMRFTSSRVAGATTCGLACVFVMIYSYQPAGDFTKTEPALIGKNQANYHFQTKVSAQWLWTVYFHHPAYEAHASSVVPISRRRV